MRITGQYSIAVETLTVITSHNLNNWIVFHRDVLSVWHTHFPDCCCCVVCDKAVEPTQNNPLDNSFQLSKQEMQQIIGADFRLVSPSPRA